MSKNSETKNNLIQFSKPTELQAQKDRIVELEEEFESLVNSGNTYGLTEASNIFADENKLYYDLVQDFTTYQLSNLEPSYDTEDLSRIERLTKPLQVIKYLRNRIIKHRDKFENEYEKLEQELHKINSELPGVRSKLQQIESNLEAIQTELTVLSIPGVFTTQNFSLKGGANTLPTTFDPDWEREFSNATVHEAMAGGLFMQAEQGIQIFTQQLGSQRNYLNEINQRLNTTTDPVEKANLRQQKEVTQNNIKETQDRLNAAKQIKQKSLEESKQIDKVKIQVQNNGTKVNSICKGMACNLITDPDLLQQYSEAASKVAQNPNTIFIKENKHLLPKTGGGNQARFNTTDPEIARQWVKEVLESPNAKYFPNPGDNKSFIVVADLGKKGIIEDFFYKSDEFHEEPILLALYYQKENCFKLDSDWKKYDSNDLILKSEIEKAFFEYVNNLKKDIVKIFGLDIWEKYREDWSL